ncbi:MAG: hypothetical protein OXR62_10780 [Ahrensia sp.]|nr:hypothetical protein [Ahrensia sp.]
MVLLALAVVLAMIDITRSVAASQIVLTPLVDSWVTINQASFDAVRSAVEAWTMDFIWDPVLLWALKIPSWLALGAVSLLLAWLGRSRSQPFGRFASH